MQESICPNLHSFISGPFSWPEGCWLPDPQNHASPTFRCPRGFGSTIIVLLRVSADVIILYLLRSSANTPSFSNALQAEWYTLRWWLTVLPTALISSQALVLRVLLLAFRRRVRNMNDFWPIARRSWCKASFACPTRSFLSFFAIASTLAAEHAGCLKVDGRKRVTFSTCPVDKNLVFSFVKSNSSSADLLSVSSSLQSSSSSSGKFALRSRESKKFSAWDWKASTRVRSRSRRFEISIFWLLVGEAPTFLTWALSRILQVPIDN